CVRGPTPTAGTRSPGPVGDGGATGIRTPVRWLRTIRPRPLDDSATARRLAARQGFEPRLTGPEPVVLPLHYRAVEAGQSRRSQSVPQVPAGLPCSAEKRFRPPPPAVIPRASARRPRPVAPAPVRDRAAT